MRIRRPDCHMELPSILGAVAAVGVLVAVCLAGACGGEQAPGAQAGAQPAREAQEVSACDLLTPAEIEEETDHAPGEAVPGKLGSGFLECRWMLADGSGQLAYAAYRPAGAPLTYEAWVDEYKASMGDDFDESMLADYELISEAGNQFAIFADGGSLGSQVQIYVNGSALILGTMAIDEADRMRLMALASKAQPRMP